MRIAHRMHRTHRIIFILFFSVFSVFSVLFSPVRSRALRGCALCATRISSIIKTHHRPIYCNSVLSVAPYSSPSIAPCSTLPPCTPIRFNTMSNGLLIKNVSPIIAISMMILSHSNMFILSVIYICDDLSFSSQAE